MPICLHLCPKPTGKAEHTYALFFVHSASNIWWSNSIQYHWCAIWSSLDCPYCKLHIFGACLLQNVMQILCFTQDQTMVVWQLPIPSLSEVTFCTAILIINVNWCFIFPSKSFGNYFYLIIYGLVLCLLIGKKPSTGAFPLIGLKTLSMHLWVVSSMINRGLAILKSSFIHRWFKMQVTIFTVM